MYVGYLGICGVFYMFMVSVTLHTICDVEVPKLAISNEVLSTEIFIYKVGSL